MHPRPSRAVLRGVLAAAGTLALVALPPLACLGNAHRDEMLYDASSEGDVAEMQRWLRLGANPNCGLDCEPSLCPAIGSGNPAAVRLLLDHGARLTDGCIEDSLRGVEDRRLRAALAKELREAKGRRKAP